MSSVNNVIVTLAYEDGTTRNYTFEGVENADLASVKEKILAINANANGEYANFYQTFVSDEGEPFSMIESAKIVTVEEETIYGS